MNLNDDVVYRCLRFGPLHQLHPGRSRSLVRYHDRLHVNCLLGYLSLCWICSSDKVAERVVQRYQTSSCEQLAAERSHPKPEKKEEMEERLVRLLHEDPNMRKEFLGRVATPIANKLFECGLIP